MSTTEQRIRLAAPADRSGVSATVEAAFVEDPAWAFIFGREYRRLAPQFIAVLFERRVRARGVWVSEDLAAVAMWEPPAAQGAEHDEAEWSGYRALAGEAAFARLQRYNAAVAAAASPQPHWYLGVLATHPGQRRRGLATAVIQPALELADHAGLDCCLETSTPANRRFYEGRGFTEASDIELAGGPRSWWLRRPAR